MGIKQKLIVKDLLSLVPAKNVVDVFIKNEQMDIEKKAYVTKKMEKLFVRLRAMDPVETDYIVLGHERVDEFENSSDVFFDISIYKKDSLLSNLSLSFPEINMSLDHLNKISDEEAGKALRSIRLPCNYAIEFMPWSEILGFEVDKENIEKYGMDNVLSGVLYELTFFGFEEEDMKKERKKLDEAVEEADEIIKLPEEEQKKYFVSAEDLFADIGFRDERTEEEKKKELLLMRRKIILNYWYMYNVIKEYVKEK